VSVYHFKIKGGTNFQHIIFQQNVLWSYPVVCLLCILCFTFVRTSFITKSVSLCPCRLIAPCIHSNGLYIIYMTYHHVLHHNSNLVALFEYLLYSILWVTIKGWKPSIKTKFYLSYLIRVTIAFQLLYEYNAWWSFNLVRLMYISALYSCFLYVQNTWWQV
jgi:hypothetical protein